MLAKTVPMNHTADSVLIDEFWDKLSGFMKMELSDLADQVGKELIQAKSKQILIREQHLYSGIEHSNTKWADWDQSPIKGIRYKWAIWNIFDLWSSWEAKRYSIYTNNKFYNSDHRHGLLKIRTPTEFRQFVQQIST